MIKLIIFDWDDVIVQGAREGYFKCYHEALLGVGISLDPEEESRRIIAKWGSTHVDELSELLKEHPELVERAAAIYEEHLFGDTFVKEQKQIPGTNDLLVRLQKKYILTVATGAHPKILQEKVFPKFEIPDVFSEVISSYDILDDSKRKPNPYVIEKLMESQHVRPEETVFIGDAKSDMQMALAALVTPIAVLTGHMTFKDAREMNIKYIIPDITHLESILEQLNNQ